MTSSDYTSNPKFSSESIFKNQMKYFPQKQESNPPSRTPSNFFPFPINNYNFSSQFLNKNLPIRRERLNSFCSNKSDQDNKLFTKSFFQMQNMNTHYSFNDFPIPEISREQSRVQSKISNFGQEYGKNLQLPKRFLFDLVEQENEQVNEQEKEEPKNEYLFGQNITNNEKGKCIILKNNIIINNNNNNFDYNDSFKTERNNNLNLNTNNNNLGTKFFTNHNYGYKCSCSKTQCNRKYCECYNSGNYCIDCNCKNCKNQPPINTYSNKRPTDSDSKMKKTKEICTCTKSGCNKNYCECFKSGNKCTPLCRCIDCENTEENFKLKNKKFYNYDCCRANSIYIIRNRLIIQDVNKSNLKTREIIMPDSYKNKNEKLFNKKRKRSENINEVNNMKKIKNNKKEDKTHVEDSLFDENGKVILRHTNLIHY